jgi:hypothetical protein
VHEPSAAHRLDHRDHPSIAQSLREMRQAVPVRRHRTLPDPLTRHSQRLPIKTLATQIQSDTQHTQGPLRLTEDARSVPPREALLHDIPAILCSPTPPLAIGIDAAENGLKS